MIPSTPSHWHWLFIKEATNQYIIFEDEKVTGEVRWSLYEDGYECIWDSARSYEEAAQEAKDYYQAKQLRCEIRPITFREAKEFVKYYHRHHLPPQGQKFSIALHDGERVVGVIIAGRPVSRHQDDGLTLEVTRCCVKPAYKNGISQLYAATCQTAKAMGYKKVITYTLTEESGSSMKASNFEIVHQTNGGSWNSSKRKREDKHPIGTKYLWMKSL